MKARQLIDAEDPKHFLQRVAPPANFEVDGKWQAWAADGAGNVLYSMEAQHPRRSKLTSIKKFNVEEYHERNGKWPKGLIKLDHISYWDWRGRYFACGGEVYQRRPRQEAEDPKQVFKHHLTRPEDVSIEDMDILHRKQPNFPVYTYSAMWKWPFKRSHWIVGCPSGSGETLHQAMRDLVDSTNRESKLKLCLTFPSTPQEEAEDPKQFLQRVAPQSIVVHCYMGHWTADRRTGMVKRWHPDSNSSDDPLFAKWAANVVAFDFDEWEKHWGRPADREIDICDIGSWDRGGRYEPPEEEYRKEERARQQ